MIGHALDGDSGKRAKKIDYQRSESRLVEVLEQVQTRFGYIKRPRAFLIVFKAIKTEKILKLVQIEADINL